MKQSLSNPGRRPKQPEGPTLFDAVMPRYERERELAEGQLIDVTDAAEPFGLPGPVALSRAAWESCVAAGLGDARKSPKDRLRDLLDCLHWVLQEHGCPRGEPVRMTLPDFSWTGDPIIELAIHAIEGRGGGVLLTVRLAKEDKPWHHP